MPRSNYNRSLTNTISMWDPSAERVSALEKYLMRSLEEEAPCALWGDAAKAGGGLSRP